MIHKEVPRQSPTFVLPPAPPAEVEVSPAAKAALAVQRALLPVVTADNDDEYSTVDDDSLAAMIAAATAAADRAGVALQAGKDEVNACPPGERSAEALDKVFHLELAKSAADQVSTSRSTTARACVSSYPSPLCVCPPLPQTLANLLGLDARRRLNKLQRTRAPTPGAGATGLWTNLWPSYGASTAEPATRPRNASDVVHDGGMSLAPLAVAIAPDAVESPVDNSKTRFALLREVDEKNDRLNDLLRQLRDPALSPEQRTQLEEELARAQQAKDEVDTKLRPLLEAVVAEQRRAVDAATRRLQAARANGTEEEVQAAEDQLKRAEGALKDVLRQLAGLGTGELVAVKAKAAADAAAAEAAANALQAELAALAEQIAALQRANADHEGRAQATAAELLAAENETAAAKRLVEALEDAVRKGSLSSGELTKQVADLTRLSADQVWFPPLTAA